MTFPHRDTPLGCGVWAHRRRGSHVWNESPAFVQILEGSGSHKRKTDPYVFAHSRSERRHTARRGFLSDVEAVTASAMPCPQSRATALSPKVANRCNDGSGRRLNLPAGAKQVCAGVWKSLEDKCRLIRNQRCSARCTAFCGEEPLQVTWVCREYFALCTPNAALRNPVEQQISAIVTKVGFYRIVDSRSAASRRAGSPTRAIGRRPTLP